MWEIVVQIRERNPVFCTNGLPYDNLVDVIKFIPVFIPMTIKHDKLFLNTTKKKSYPGLASLIKGSNFGPPGIAMFNALAVKKLLVSKR